MKAITLALAGLLGLAALQPAQAQFAVPPGPFASQQALTNWWNVNNTSGMVTEVFFNGRKVYDKPTGFGPALVAAYYSCSLTNDVRMYCNRPSDGATRLDYLIDLYDTGIGTRPATADKDIYLDGQLVRAHTTPSRAGEVYLLKCLGDPSRRGGFYYYKLHRVFPDFSPPYIGKCYP